MHRSGLNFYSYGNAPYAIRASRGAGGNRLAGETSQRRWHPDRRVERRRPALRHWAYSGCGAHRLAGRSPGQRDPRLHQAGKIRGVVQPQWDYAGDDVHFLRRQGELVGMLRALGVPVVRAREGENSEWRPGQMESGAASHDARDPEISENKLSCAEEAVR